MAHHQIDRYFTRTSDQFMDPDIYATYVEAMNRLEEVDDIIFNGSLKPPYGKNLKPLMAERRQLMKHIITPTRKAHGWTI